MHPRIAQLITSVGVVILVAACEDPQLAPVSDIPVADQPVGDQPVGDQPVGDQALFVQGGPEPRAPTSLNATAISGSQIELSWQDNSPNESGFEVHRSPQQNGSYNLVTTTVPNIKSYTDEGRTPATEYCYQIRALKRSGSKTTYSAFTDPVCVTTKAPPAAPSEATAVPENSNTIAITWKESSTDESGFRVQRGPAEAGPWETVATTVANATQAQDFVPSEVQFCYRVVAFNGDGEGGASNVVCTAAPATPYLVAEPVDEQTIKLTWQPSAVADGYQLLRFDPALGQWSELPVLPATPTEYLDGGLVSDLTYWYLMRATRDGGYSYYSNYAQALIVSAPPAAPSNIVAYPLASSLALVYWTDNSGTEQGFRLERGPSTAGPWETIGESATDEWYFYDYGVTADQQVCYRAIAFNSKGPSGASDPDCTVPPAAPTNLQATAFDHQTIDLTWDPYPNDPYPAVKDGYTIREGYRVFRFDYWSWEYVAIADLPADATSFRDTGLEGQTWYSYYIAALNDGDPNYGGRGSSDWSNEANATTHAAPDAGPSVTAARPGPSAAVVQGAAARALTKALQSRKPAGSGVSSASKKPPLPR